MRIEAPISPTNVFIDAGFEILRCLNSDGSIFEICHHGDIRHSLDSLKHPPPNSHQFYITGNLAAQVRSILGKGFVYSSQIVLASAGESLMKRGSDNKEDLVIIEISASGHRIAQFSETGQINHFKTHARCGGGTGFNIDRILGKLNLNRTDVDQILVHFCGPESTDHRESLPVRHDRCGVFLSSAAVSDKNIGIPVANALATVLKSEVIKAAQKIALPCTWIYASGGLFRYRFVREVFCDFMLKKIPNGKIEFDTDCRMSLLGLKHCVDTSPGLYSSDAKPEIRIRGTNFPELIPSFSAIRKKLEKDNLFHRFELSPNESILHSTEVDSELSIGLDVGSTMAKMLVMESSGQMVFKTIRSNHGDTACTIQAIFNDLSKAVGNRIQVKSVGVTGSARVQVRKLLLNAFPQLEGSIFVESENIAHATGSIEWVRNFIERSSLDIHRRDVFAIIDIGGEDTKISLVETATGLLLDNAMNLKCSAGTGSLMDLLVQNFELENAGAAYENAYRADSAYAIDATCAVFLMEKARRLQSEGVSIDQILASCCHAIVENMARSLWPLVNIPGGCIVLLHGQTMQSDALPLAVAHRVQKYLKTKTPCLVPPLPGFRASMGMIQHASLSTGKNEAVSIDLDTLNDMQIERLIFTCGGKACGNPETRCHRIKLTTTIRNSPKPIFLGGCSAIQDEAKTKEVITARNGVLLFSDRMKSVFRRELSTGKRVVIPRSFSASQWGLFLAYLLRRMGMNVWVDSVLPADISEGSRLFSLDTCAPHIGAAGQLIRLAREQQNSRAGNGNETIVIPVIDKIPCSDGLGKTCTINQGGWKTAIQFMLRDYPSTQYILVDLQLKDLHAQKIASWLLAAQPRLLALAPQPFSNREFREIVERSIVEYTDFIQSLTVDAAILTETAYENGQDLAIVCGREYLLNPGIYDSFASKLLHEKNIASLPMYVLDHEDDPDFSYIYWANSLHIVSVLSAMQNGGLHELIRNSRLKEAIRRYENRSIGKPRLVPCLVSTFRCGPDSMTYPLIYELYKDKPLLVLQSDGLLKELAHLETRVATMANLWRQDRTNACSNTPIGSKPLSQDFRVSKINDETDILYLPTLHDNRLVAAAFRSAGLTVFDLFTPDSFDLAGKCERGRLFAGNSVCAPMACLLGDIAEAFQDFHQRKQESPESLRNKTRVLVFSPSGYGPCRQGMYSKLHELMIPQLIAMQDGSGDTDRGKFQLKLLVGDDTDLYRIEMPEWVYIRCIQSLVLSDALRSFSFKLLSQARSMDEYRTIQTKIENLKRSIISIIENSKPGLAGRTIGNLGRVGRYAAYGIWNHLGIPNLIKSFRKQNTNHETAPPGFKIHADGEIYMRVAQSFDVFETLTELLGFGTFDYDVTPLWIYLEYVVMEKIMTLSDEVAGMREIITFETKEDTNIAALNSIKTKENQIKTHRRTLLNLRKHLVEPIYSAFGLSEPPLVSEILELARPVIPDLLPKGELAMYIGEAIHQGRGGTDVLIHIAPESCMVSTMGDALTGAILNQVNNPDFSILSLFSLNGETDRLIIESGLIQSKRGKALLNHR